MVPPAVAQNAGAAACIDIAAPLARLSCYDGVFKPAPSPAEPAKSQWQVSSERSATSGWNNIFLEVASIHKVPVDFGDAQHGNLRIRCIDNVTSLLFWFGGNYMSDFGTYGQVSYQIGNGVRQTFEADATGDNQYIGLLTGAKAIPFVQQMFGAKTLSVSALPINESDTPVTMRFNIIGASDALLPLRESCNW